MKKSLAQIIFLSVIFIGMISCDDDGFQQITETYEGTLTVKHINAIGGTQHLNSISFPNVHLIVKKSSETEATLSFVEDDLQSGGIPGIDSEDEEVIFYSEYSIKNSIFRLTGYYPSYGWMIDIETFPLLQHGYGIFEYNSTLKNNAVTYTNDESGYIFVGTTIVLNEDSEIEGSVVNQQININFGDIFHFVGEKK